MASVRRIVHQLENIYNSFLNREPNLPTPQYRDAEFITEKNEILNYLRNKSNISELRIKAWFSANKPFVDYIYKQDDPDAKLVLAELLELPNEIKSIERLQNAAEEKEDKLTRTVEKAFFPLLTHYRDFSFWKLSDLCFVMIGDLEYKRPHHWSCKIKIWDVANRTLIERKREKKPEIELCDHQHIRVDDEIWDLTDPAKPVVSTRYFPKIPRYEFWRPSPLFALLPNQQQALRITRGDNEISLWDVNPLEEKPLVTFNFSSDPTHRFSCHTNILILEDGEHFIAGCATESGFFWPYTSLCLWNVNQPDKPVDYIKLIRSYENYNTVMLTMLPNKKQFLAQITCNNNIIYLIDIPARRIIREFMGPDRNDCHTISVLPDNQHFIAHYTNNCAWLWDKENTKPITKLIEKEQERRNFQDYSYLESDYRWSYMDWKKDGCEITTRELDCLKIWLENWLKSTKDRLAKSQLIPVILPPLCRIVLDYLPIPDLKHYSFFKKPETKENAAKNAADNITLRNNL